MDPKRQRLMAGALVALGIVIWGWDLTAKPRRSKRALAPIPQPTVQNPQRDTVSAQSRQSRYAQWGENPFLTEHRKAAISTPGATALSDPVLNGILWDSKIPSAIVNGRLVNVGDTLDQWQVLEIQKDRVVLSDGATTKTLILE